MMTWRRRPRSNATIDLAAPILPTFAFAPAGDLMRLLVLRSAASSPVPAFSILRDNNQAAIVRDDQLSQLRWEEDDAAARHAALLQAKADKLDREERASLLRTEKARRKALRAQPRHGIAIGARMAVDGASPFAGMFGAVEIGDGRFFVISFAGSLDIELEGWQLIPVDVDGVC